MNRQAEQEGRHSIEGCHSTRTEALAQQRALYANEPSAGRQAIREVEQMKIERLVLPIESKAVTDTDGGEITGYAAVYGNVDLQDDLLEPGSFAKSAEDWSRAKSRLPLLDWHGESIDRIIGSVSQLKSVPQGLWFRAGFTTDERGQRARQLAKDGHLTGVSVGWMPIHQGLRVIGGKAVRVVREARVHEISLTPIPANPLAQLASVKSLDLEVKAVSDKPWSQFTQADYTPEQWRRACLIDTGEGDPDSKDRYKLPVREPDGTVNRNGVHAAAGGHGLGQVQGISPEKRTQAAQAIIRLYGMMGEEPPDSMRRMAGMMGRSSLDYAIWAPAMRKALEIGYEPAAKAAAYALLDAYNRDDLAAGLADEPPTAPPAADGTGDPDSSTPMTASQYALSIISPGPRDDAPAGTPPDGAAYSRQLLEDLRTSDELAQLEAEINHALGREPT